MAYDAAKATEVNQLIEAGLTPQEAIELAGIPEDELGDYSYDLQTSQLNQQFGPPTPDPEPNDDPFEAARLEAEQALNREDLALNATYVEPDNDFFGSGTISSQPTTTAAPLNDPYAGLSAQQLEALGGADPTDPYIRARLGIPQLPAATLLATPAIGTIKTGVPLVDNALNFITGLFGGKATTPAVTQTGTTTGSPAAAPDTAPVAQAAAQIIVQDTNLSQDKQVNLINIDGAQVEIDRANENIQTNNRSLLANEEAQAEAQASQQQSLAIIEQNNLELADENLPDDRRAELEANNAAQQDAILQNAAVIDEAQNNIDSATSNIDRQQASIQQNQTVIADNASAFTANDGSLLVQDDGVPEFIADPADSFVEADNTLTILSEEETAALFDGVDTTLVNNFVEAEAPADVELDQDPVEDIFVEAEAPEDVGDEDPFEAARLEAEQELNREDLALNATEVEPESDPFEAARLEAEAALDEQPQEFSPADVGEEDPFEAARLEQEQELNREDLALNATDVEPDQDPFEASRLEAEAALDEQPQEFSPEDVGEEDPFEAARLEREQELNREDLEINATEAEPVDAEALGDSYGFNSEETENADPTLLAGEEDVEDAQSRRVNAAQKSAINQATLQARYKQPANDDWRVRLSLSIGANYLYKDPSPGILAPLAKTDGVVFPYTPKIDTSYVANYEKSDLVHSNYRGAFYKNSAVQDVNISGTFTAQDTNEAAYMLAVIHFFRSVTKMFYGKDAQRGAPPPLVYLTGFGDFQFAGHPCVVTNFGYTLPSDVDYIRANNPNNYGTDLLNRRAAAVSAPVPFSSQLSRLINSGLGAVPGAQPNTPTQSPVTQSVANTARATYVPTKIEISITLLPMQTRDQISKQFSLKDFANGKLIQGGFW